MKFVPYHIRKRLKEITAPENVDVTDVSKLKSGLSGKIWEKGGILKPEVRTKMIELGKEFYKSLGIDYPIKDIFFTGSLANYNWTSHSDADVHVLFEAPEEDEFLSEYIFAKKEVWSDKHNITIYGFPVELFAKNVEDEHGSKAIYSLLQNKWVKKPSKKNVNIDSESIQIKTADLMNKIDDVEKISDDEKRFDAADKLKDKIKKMRQASLEAGGEYSTENLVFKTLRNNGYLDKLSDIKTMSFDKQKSLNEVELMNSPIKRNTLKVQKGIPGMTEEKINILKDFICFTCAKLKMQDAVTVVIKKGRDESIITTASYIPGTNENHIRAGGRAIVDICRSIGHELTHNRQRELGIFNPGDQVQNIGGQIEDEANSIAGILIKDFSHNYGYDNIYEL
jgi:hypothetical protein